MLLYTACINCALNGSFALQRFNGSNAIKILNGIPYSGKLSREKTFANWWKYDFRRENFRGLLAFAVPKDATPQISRRKLSCIATKLRNSWKFSPSKVSRYTVMFNMYWDCHIYIYMYVSPLVCVLKTLISTYHKIRTTHLNSQLKYVYNSGLPLASPVPEGPCTSTRSVASVLATLGMNSCSQVGWSPPATWSHQGYPGFWSVPGEKACDTTTWEPILL